MISAILFSKPSRLSLEKGRSFGSAQTLSSVRDTSSTPVCAVADPTRPSSPINPAGRAALIIAGPFRPAPPERAVGPRLQVAVDIVEIIHHILRRAEGRHDVVGRGRDVLSAVDHDLGELVMVEMLQGIRES